MMYSTFLNTGRAIVIALLIALQLSCTGENKSAAGTPLPDSPEFGPSSLNVPIFYIMRTIPVDLELLEEPHAFNPGAHLYYRSSASTSASETNITARIHGASALYDVKDISVSADGNRILFAMHPPEADPDNPVFTWDIWEYQIDTDNLRRVIPVSFVAIKGSSQDVSPAYLPIPDPSQPDKIAMVFASTRQETNRAILIDELKASYSGLEEGSASGERDLANGAVQAFSLHVFDETLGTNDQLKQITFNQSHDFDPVVLSSGKILYTRWDNINSNDVFSFYRTTPNGAENSLMYGYHSHASLGSDGGPALVRNLQIAPNGKLIGVLKERDIQASVLGGPLIELDVENYIDINTPTASNAGLLTPAQLPITNENILTDDRLSVDGRYSSIYPFNDGSDRLLVSWAACLTEDAGLVLPCPLNLTGTLVEPEFGIWVLDATDPSQLIRQPIVGGETGFMVTEAVIAETRAAPAFVNPPLNTLVDSDLNARAILNIKSIYDLDGNDIAPGGAGILAHANPVLNDPATIEARFLRIEKQVSIPDEATHDFANTAFGLSNNRLMREIVGYLPIEPDGSVRGLVPANIPLTFSVVDDEGKRVDINSNINSLHPNWIQLAPNETYQCVGCHDNNSTAPHGRVDAQPDSVNPGAPTPGIFPNTEQALGEIGLTMAESYARFILADPAPDPRERLASSDLNYIDEWTDPASGTPKAAPILISYNSLTTPNPESPACKFDSGGLPVPWTALCRIVINYEDHIQPIWEETRTPTSDGVGPLVDTCVGCHTSLGGTQVPSAQLDLTNTASDRNAAHFTSYRELLQGDGEQTVNGGMVTERQWECSINDEDGNVVVDAMSMMPVKNIVTPNGFGASASIAGAGASDDFFNCFDADDNCRENIGVALPADNSTPFAITECVELAGNPVLSNPNRTNHNNLLTAEELRLIAEWLDLGGQYYNNPFDAP